MQQLQQSDNILAACTVLTFIHSFMLHLLLTSAVYAYTLLPPASRSSSDTVAFAGNSYMTHLLPLAFDADDANLNVSGAAAATAAAVDAAQQRAKFAWLAAAAAAGCICMPQHTLRPGCDLLAGPTGVSMLAAV
jgi:hypothetical protein